MDNLFKALAKTPPCYRNQPPVSGSIIWEKSLFYRMKHSIVRFLQLEELMQTDRGKQSRGHYLDVGRRMRAYEQTRYADWIQKVDQVLPTLLKKTLLLACILPLLKLYSLHTCFFACAAFNLHARLLGVHVNYKCSSNKYDSLYINSFYYG